MDHPLYNLIKFYIDNFKTLKNTHLDLATLDYNQNYSLSVDPPNDWPHVEILSSIVEYSKKVFDSPFKAEIIYSSVPMYDQLNKRILRDNMVSFLSWQEIFYAIHTSSNDSRGIRDLRDRLFNAKIVIVVGVLHSSEVLDQIKANTDGCLIVLG